jgi:hypothetical protein
MAQTTVRVSGKYPRRLLSQLIDSLPRVDGAPQFDIGDVIADRSFGPSLEVAADVATILGTALVILQAVIPFVKERRPRPMDDQGRREIRRLVEQKGDHKNCRVEESLSDAADGTAVVISISVDSRIHLQRVIVEASIPQAGETCELRLGEVERGR